MFLLLRGTTFICTLTFFNGLFLDYPLFKKQGLVIVETLWSTSKLISFFHNAYKVIVRRRTILNLKNNRLTLFRLGFLVNLWLGGGGLLGPPPPSVSLEPIMLGSWNLHTMIISIQRSPTQVLTCHAQWWRHSDVIFRFFNVSYYFST